MKLKSVHPITKYPWRRKQITETENVFSWNFRPKYQLLAHLLVFSAQPQGFVCFYFLMFWPEQLRLIHRLSHELSNSVGVLARMPSECRKPICSSRRAHEYHLRRRVGVECGTTTGGHSWYQLVCHVYKMGSKLFWVCSISKNTPISAASKSSWGN